MTRLEELLAEIDERNADNVSRTDSYLELYAFTREHPPDLPWLLMAHLVSRNGGYLMCDVARSLDNKRSVFSERALIELFLLLERANYLIFFDAWHHVIHHLLGRSGELAPGRSPRFVRDAWLRYERARRGRGVDLALERGLVEDLVTNEQNYIERRVVHHPRFDAPRAIITFIEAVGSEAPIVLPDVTTRICVGGFALLERRIATGMRIFDEAIADRARRDAAFEWARSKPHDGSRSVYGGKPGPRLRDAWPVTEVRALWTGIHAAPEPDPAWP